MIHLIAGKKIGVEVERAEAEDGTRPECCWGRRPSKGGHEAGGSRVGCAEARAHVEQGRVEKHENEGGVTRHRWNASSWIGIASGSP